MTVVTVDFNRKIGPFKPMNAINNGPLPYTEGQTWTNFSDYKKLRLPYARTHDASFCSRYGGEHTVDVNFIFPDFSADVTDPDSYDFQLTDEYLKSILDAGTEPFFRLGSKIEHWSKKYNTRVPEDYLKWARICEHIIAHYTEGWADGYNWKITYWEIWNEPDMRGDNEPPENKPTWSGTKAQFFDFYKTAARHLKRRFPKLKIGGPAVANMFTSRVFGAVTIVKPWIDEFLKFVSENKIPLDFFSWHSYTDDVQWILEGVKDARKYLDKYGLTKTESILDEWNYLYGWKGDDFIETVKSIGDERGAAFSAAVMCACQNAPVDMLMYYDAQPSVFNGLFDFYTLQPKIGYYPFFMFSQLALSGTQTFASSSDKDVYALAADGDKKAAMIVHYPSPKDKTPRSKSITIKGFNKEPELYLTDKTHRMERINNYTYAFGELNVYLPPLSVLFVRQ
ncbi:MAG: hypothetical protein J5781_07080 [Clostridia bacterium]|nr:hypothetical protein [Clostridia bacterium]